MTYNINDTGHVDVHNAVAITLTTLPATITTAITAQAEPIGLSPATQATIASQAAGLSAALSIVFGG